ncbi:MAG: TonB-dependent receptor [Candidatus Tectimicrobiota bacterium]
MLPQNKWNYARYAAGLAGCGLLLTLIGAVPLRAQPGAAPPPAGQGQESLLVLEPMVITGRADDLIGVAGSASEGRVGQAEFKQRPLLRPGEVLEVVPGLVVTQHSGTGKANQYFLRGFNLDHGTDFSTWVDGVPVNLPTHAHGQGYMDVNFLIPELVDYVTFRKGPSYADVGDFSSAGTAAFSLLHDLPQGLLKLSVGLDDYYRLVFANAPQLGSGTLLYAFEGNFYNGPWERTQRYRKLNGLLKYSLTHGPQSFAVGMTAFSSRWNSTDQIPLRAVEQGILSRLGTIDSSDGGVTSRYSLYANWSYKGQDSLTKASGYFVYYTLDLFSNFTYFLDDPENGDQFEQKDQRMVVGGSVSQTWFTRWLRTTMDHTLGLQVRHDAIPEVGLHKTRRRERLSTVRDDTVHETSVGMYYQNHTQWLPHVRTVLGLRGDVFVFKVDSDLAVNSGNRSAALFSPKLGLVLGPWASTEVYLNGGFGFHSNDARGTTIRVDPGSGEAANRVDPLVRTQGAEIGVRSTWIPGLNSTLAFWYLRLDSELLFVGDAGTTEASRPSQRFGLEWANFYKVLPWLTLDFDLSYANARFTNSDPAGRHIPGSIELVIASGAAVDLPNGIFGSVRARHFGSRPLMEDNSVRSASTTLFNLQGGYKYNNWQAQFDLLNVLKAHDSDIDYFYASRLPGEPVAGVEDLHFHPVEPRTVRFSVAYRF